MGRTFSKEEIESGILEDIIVEEDYNLGRVVSRRSNAFAFRPRSISHSNAFGIAIKSGLFYLPLLCSSVQNYKLKRRKRFLTKQNVFSEKILVSSRPPKRILKVLQIFLMPLTSFQNLLYNILFLIYVIQSL